MHQIIIGLKNQGQGGYTPPEEIDRALNNASTDKFNHEKGLFEANGTISNNLKNFKTKSTITLTAGSGPLPDGYDYRTNASTTDNKRITIIPDSEWVEVLSDPIDGPDSDHPFCSVSSTITVVPNTLTSMYLYYLRVPATMVFGYTLDGNNDPIYDSGTSVSSDWPTSADPDIIRRSCVYLGIPLSDQGMVGIENIIKNQGA